MVDTFNCQFYATPVFVFVFVVGNVGSGGGGNVDGDGGGCGGGGVAAVWSHQVRWRWLQWEPRLSTHHQTPPPTS